MNQSKEYRKSRKCVFLMHVHLIFVTKYRKVVISGRVLNDLRKIFANVCQDFEAQMVECNGEGDHIHLLINYHPKVSISSIVNSLKGVSSRLIRKMCYPEVQNALWGKSFWSPSYFASSCGGAPISVIQKYVKEQSCLIGELSSRP